MDIFFTADTHFNHKNIIKYCNRPFDSVEDMNETIIQNWNKKVTRSSTHVYHLGDFSFFKGENILDRLNGTIILIKGNHDKDAKRIKHRFKEISSMNEVNIDGIPIILCHFCLRVWDRSHFNSWHLYGHSHGTLPPIGKSWDVGVDNNKFEILSYEEIKEIMKNRPDNPNLIKRDDR